MNSKAEGVVMSKERTFAEACRDEADRAAKFGHAFSSEDAFVDYLKNLIMPLDLASADGDYNYSSARQEDQAWKDGYRQ